MSFGLALMLAWGSAAAEPAEPACGIYSQTVYSVGEAWSGCWLKRAGEKPLWRDALEPGVVQIVRFVFSSGRDSSFRYITLVQRADGKSWLVSGGLDAQYRLPRNWWPRRRKTMIVSEWEEIDRLVKSSGAFDFEVGTWDSDEIYVHCQNLAMERVDRTGYRFSAVSIGCNRPEKLAPLVDRVIELAGRQALFAGWTPSSKLP